MKILAVDDSKTIRKFIIGTVEVLGHTPIEAGNGKEALQVLQTQYQDVGLILLDINMPEMNGFETLAALQADERFCKIPVMMVTTESERKSISQAIRSGAKHYVTKPFTIQDLTARIMECLGMADGLDLEL